MNINFNLFSLNSDRTTLIGFEVTFFPATLSGYRVKARVSPADMVALYYAGMLHSDICYLWVDTVTGKEHKGFAKFWYREIKDSSGKFVRWAFRVSSLSGTPLIEDEGFTEGKTEFSNSVWIGFRDKKNAELPPIYLGMESGK